MVYGGIEAGGTKIVCGIGTEELGIVERVSFPTTTPKETLGFVIDFFEKYKEELEAIGIGSFGPIDIQKDSPSYGYITSTPKIAWQNFDFVGEIKNAFPNLPVAWTTDVNAACYGEYMKGHGKDKTSVVYYTIGTGIGGSALQNGIFVEGFSHPEMGHMFIRRHEEDSFVGNCPFHHDCLEGLAAGPAIEQRIGKKAQNLAETDAFWDIEAGYIAQCAYNSTLLFSPDVIILGGGVMKQEQLIKKVREKFTALMNNYVKTPDLENYLVTPQLEDNAGIIGCIALAKEVSKVHH